MRVNRRFFASHSTRKQLRFCFAVAASGLLLVASAFGNKADHELKSKRMNLLVREIGHRLLLQAGDSITAVPPVTELKDGVFQMSFTNEMGFNHDSLMALAKERFPVDRFPSGYMVTVHDCRNNGIVYGFQVNPNAKDILACRGRVQPMGCYTFEIAFPGIYDKAEGEKADSKQGLASVFEEETTPGVEGSDPDSDANDPNRPDQGNIVERQNSKGEFPVMAIFGGSLLFAGTVFVIARFAKKQKSTILTSSDTHDEREFSTQVVSDQIQKEQVVEEGVGQTEEQNSQQEHKPISEPAVPELPSIGKYQFDSKKQFLHLGAEKISLTDKETKVLTLLHQNFGELITRDTLLQEVWINEGVITSRSLDMFVSKLRKKLSLDDQLRITSIHGKGYKLDQIA